jgi:hypothetical protein
MSRRIKEREDFKKLHGLEQRRTGKEGKDNPLELQNT